MKTSRKIPKAFILFLIISFFIWILISLSKEYSNTIKFPVTYKNIPQNKLLQKTPLKELEITVKATGFNLIKTKFQLKKIALEASNLKKGNNSKYYFLPKKQLKGIQKQLRRGVIIQEILRDTIYLDLGILTSKKVAVEADLKINYQIGYNLVDEVVLKPDSVTIFGPEKQVRTIKTLTTKKLSLNDVKDDFSKEIEIIKPNELYTLRFKPQKITISGKVEKFTEGTLQIPFTIKNVPKNINITTLTKTVDVVFVVSLSNFTKVSETSFEVECNYLTTEKDNLGYLLPKLTQKPDFIKSYKIVPKQIDFLIQK